MRKVNDTIVRYDPLKVGGVLYIVAVFQSFVFELVAETLYPDFSISSNYISDLGATCVSPPSIANCVVHQPSAIIFDTSSFLLGLMLLVGTVFVYLGTRNRPYFAVTAVYDLAYLLVGVFPENTGKTHLLVSAIGFLFAGISLVLAWTIVKKHAFGYFAVAFGVLTLFLIAVKYIDAFPQLGVGGEEQLLVLPALLGVFALGAYLAGQDSSAFVAKERAPA